MYEEIGLQEALSENPIWRNKSPVTISADAAYDARNTRQYNRNRGIRSNIPANRRFRRLQNERSFWFDQELYKERNAIERFFGWSLYCPDL